MYYVPALKEKQRTANLTGRALTFSKEAVRQAANCRVAYSIFEMYGWKTTVIFFVSQPMTIIP